MNTFNRVYIIQKILSSEKKKKIISKLSRKFYSYYRYIYTDNEIRVYSVRIAQ